MASNPTAPAAVFASLHRKPHLSDAAVKENREAAIRDAKQHVREVVRNDWSFDPPAKLFSSLSPVSSDVPLAASTSSAPTTSGLPPEVVEWRLREYASSESDPEGESGSTAARIVCDRDPYRFESPEAIRASIVERRRKRRTELKDETRWNPGLRFWSERRDAWTGARKQRVLLATTGDQKGGRRQRSTDVGDSDSTFETISSQEQQHDVASRLADRDNHRSSVAVDAGTETTDQNRHETSRGSTSSVISTNELLETLSLSQGKGSGQSWSKDEDDDSDESLIPVVEPFIPTSNPIRSSITPTLYASIYSKVVVQGLTPTIPINLKDVTKATVEGWKTDGQWPPKPSVPVPGFDVPARRKGSHTQAHNEPGGGNRPTRKSSHNSGVTSAVKKVLGLSHHGFHLRRSSRGTIESEQGPGETPITEFSVVEEGGR